VVISICPEALNYLRRDTPPTAMILFRAPARTVISSPTGSKVRAWLRATLGEAAAAGVRSRNSYLQAQYRRLAGRRGKKRALLAVGHTILVAAWHMISNEADYQVGFPS